MELGSHSLEIATEYNWQYLICGNHDKHARVYIHNKRQERIEEKNVIKYKLERGPKDTKAYELTYITHVIWCTFTINYLSSSLVTTLFWIRRVLGSTGCEVGIHRGWDTSPSYGIHMHTLIQEIEETREPTRNAYWNVKTGLSIQTVSRVQDLTSDPGAVRWQLYLLHNHAPNNQNKDF